MKSSLRSLLWLWIALAAAPGTAKNLVVNGSFEEPAIGFGGFEIFPSIPGWTTTFGSGIEIQNHAAGTPFAGNQLVEMDSSDNSGMEQVIPTVAGKTYVLSFMYSPRPGVPASSSGIQVSVNGNVIDTIAVDGTGLSDTVWTRHSYSVTAVGNSTTIGFLAVGTSDSVGGFLDAVSFEGRGAALPVPALAPENFIGLAILVAVIASSGLATR
jgi:Protein of unknown function (DUF642)